MTIVNVPSISAAFAPGAPPTTLKWFRDGIPPPAPGAAALADRLNVLLARRQRVLFSHSQNSNEDANFNTHQAADIVIYRAAFWTGPSTTRIRAHFVTLPVATTPSGTPYAQMKLFPGLTGTTSTLSQALFVNGFLGVSSDFAALTHGEQEFAVGASQPYRFELHLAQYNRLVSMSLFEVPLDALDTAASTAVVDPAPFVAGQPITNTSISSMIQAADKVWKHGHYLGSWVSDYPSSQRTTTSATAANISDASTTATTSTAGLPIGVPYSGSLSSSNVPVYFWCYAGMSSGSGQVQFRDQNNTTVGSLTITALDWYAVAGNLTDQTNGTATTKIDLYIKSDGVNTLSLYSAGLFMHSGADILTVPPLSWLGTRPRYVGSISEVITKK